MGNCSGFTCKWSLPMEFSPVCILQFYLNNFEFWCCIATTEKWVYLQMVAAAGMSCNVQFCLTTEICPGLCVECRNNFCPMQPLPRIEESGFVCWDSLQCEESELQKTLGNLQCFQTVEIATGCWLPRCD